LRRRRCVGLKKNGYKLLCSMISRGAANWSSQGPGCQVSDFPPSSCMLNSLAKSFAKPKTTRRLNDHGRLRHLRSAKLLRKFPSASAPTGGISRQIRQGKRPAFGVCVSSSLSFCRSSNRIQQGPLLSRPQFLPRFVNGKIVTKPSAENVRVPFETDPKWAEYALMTANLAPHLRFLFHSSHRRKKPSQK